MARKQTFSNKRGQRGRPRLTYGELAQRARTGEQGTERRHVSRPSRPSRPPRDVTEGPGPRRTAPGRPVAELRGRPTPRRRKGLTKTHLAVGGAVAFVLLMTMLFLIFVYPSPIGGLAPAAGGCVKTPNVDVKATVDKSFKPGDLTLKVDGKDVTTSVKVNKKQVSAQVPLADGSHTAELVVSGGGLMGKRAAKWSFKVDSTAPSLKVTKKTVTSTKDPNEVLVDVKGTAEPGAMVKVGEAQVSADAKGNFTGKATASRTASLKISALDAAGNEAADFVVTQKPVNAKGVHVSVYVAGSDNDLAKMIGLLERTELNALQIDLKDEAGQIAFRSEDPLAQQVKATNNYIKLDACVDQMRYKGIYTICRIVTFKDPKLAKGRPDLAVQDTGGGLWGKGQWLDPYSREVWDYNLSVAEAAAKAGFQEVQFDYVRFPSDGNTSTCLYPHKDARQPGQVISDFLSYARQKLAPYNVFISADLFGLTASDQGDMNIGQRVGDVAERVDYISPMVYPSHYNLGEYDIKVPEANPGDTVTKSLEDFQKKMKGTQAKLRPWLQDFSLKITYTPDMVRRQIDACEALGINQWLLWDPDCSYSESALKSTSK